MDNSGEKSPAELLKLAASLNKQFGKSKARSIAKQRKLGKES